MSEQQSGETGQEQATRVVLIRHGETAWNAVGRIQGHFDEPLNEVGRWQARRLAAALVDEDIEHVYASDLSRAFETATIVAARIGCDVVADAGLRERAFGGFEGLTFHEIEQRWPEQSMRWRRRDPQFGPAGGEVLAMFYSRCVDVSTRLAAAHTGETIALVAHGGVLDCLYRAATHIPLEAPRSWLVGNATINRLLYTPQGFTLVGWSDAQHLEPARPNETRDDLMSPSTDIGQQC